MLAADAAPNKPAIAYPVRDHQLKRLPLGDCHPPVEARDAGTKRSASWMPHSSSGRINWWTATSV
jgi:hypothetical protein